jgi:hypothetical protein
MNVGPKRYEGWTCNGCDKIDPEWVDGEIVYYCNTINKFIDGDTPKECPYMKVDSSSRFWKI